MPFGDSRGSDGKSGNSFRCRADVSEPTGDGRPVSLEPEADRAVHTIDPGGGYSVGWVIDEVGGTIAFHSGWINWSGGIPDMSVMNDKER